MGKTYFIDESGSSGDIVTEQSVCNFSSQPFFSLACIGVDNLEVINEFALRLIKKYKIQAKEFKSTSVCKRKDYIVPELVEYLVESGCQIFIEVVDKKYQICSQLLYYYVLCPYFESAHSSSLKNQRFKRMLCDFLYLNVTDRHIYEFSRACSTLDDSSTVYIEKCFENMMDVVKMHPEVPGELEDFVKDSLDVFNLFKEKQGISIAKKRFIPLPDYASNKRYGMLPNINSLANIYARINKANNGLANIAIVHDEQREFKEPLRDILQVMHDISSNASLKTRYADFNIKGVPQFDFRPSQQEYGIQFADILAGAFMRYVMSVQNGFEISEHFLESYKKIVRINSVAVGINLVVPSDLYLQLNRMQVPL